VVQITYLVKLIKSCLEALDLCTFTKRN